MNKTYKIIFNRLRGTLMVANEMTRSVQRKSAKCVLAAAAIAMMTVGTAQGASGTPIVWDSAIEELSSVDAFVNTNKQYLKRYPENYSRKTDIAYGVYIKKGSDASGTVTEDLTVKLESNGIETVGAIFNNKAYVELESYPTFASKNLTISAHSWHKNANVSALYVAEGGAICIDSPSSDNTPTKVSLSASSTYGGFVVGILSHGERYYDTTTENGGTIKIKTDSLTVNATVESVEEITDNNGTTRTQKKLSAPYDGQVFGIHTSDKPGTGKIYLDAKEVNFNIKNKAEFESGGDGATYGIDVTRGDIVSGLFEEGIDTTGTTFTITATAGYGASDKFSMGGIRNEASTVNLGHETVTIKLNATKEGDAYTGTAATDAKGISVKNYSNYGGAAHYGAGSVTLKGKLVEEIRSDTASATGIYVGGNDVTEATSTAAVSKVTVNKGADILAYTKRESAFGLSLDGYEAAYVEGSTIKKAYGSITIKDTVNIVAKAEGFAETDNPTVIGVTSTKGTVTLGTKNNAEKTVRITATGSTNKILDASTNEETGKYTTAIKSENSNIAIYGKTVEITSSGDGIVVSGEGVTGEEELQVLAGTIADTGDEQNQRFSSTFLSGSFIKVEAQDNAIFVKGDTTNAEGEEAAAALGAGSVTLKANGNGKTNAVSLEKGTLAVLGNSITIESQGSGLSAINNSEVNIGVNAYDQASETISRAQTITISSLDRAIFADTGSTVNLCAENMSFGKNDSAVVGTIFQVANNASVAPSSENNRTSLSINASGDISISGLDSGVDFVAFDVGKGSEFTVEAGRISTQYVTKAIVARGDAKVDLSAGENTSLNGNLVFTKDSGYTNGTEIAASGNVNFTLDGGTSKNAKWTGNSTIEHDVNTAFSAAVNNFAGKFIATLKNGASWITSAGENFFTKVSLENGSSIDAGNATEFRIGGAVATGETQSIDVRGTGNSLKLGKTTETGTLTVRMLKSSEGTTDVKPELIVNAWAAINPTVIADDGKAIIAAAKRLSFVSPTTDTNCAVGTLVVSDAFTIGMGAFNAVFTGEDGAIDTYMLTQGTLATASGVSGGETAVANINNKVYLNAITGDGEVTVAAGKRLETAPYTVAGTTSTASTTVKTLTLEGSAQFYATNNSSVNVKTKLVLGASATAEITSSAAGDARTVTEIGELSLANGAIFKAKNNKRVIITSGTTGTGSRVLLGDDTASTKRVDIGSFTVGEASSLNVKKSAVFGVETSLTLCKAARLSSLNNDLTEIEEIFLADGEADTVVEGVTTEKHTRAEFTSNSTSSTGRTKISKVRLGNYATVSVTGNSSAQVGQILAGSGITGEEGTGANAKVTVTNNQSVTFYGSIATGENAVITVKENSETAFIGAPFQAISEINLGSKTKFTAEDATVKVSDLKLANGVGAGDDQYTLFSVTGVGSSGAHYAFETIDITNLYLGKYAHVDLKDNYKVKVTNVYAGVDSSSTGTADAGLGADVAISGSKTVEVTNLNLGKKGSFTAKTGIETVKIASITTTDSDSEANQTVVDIAGTSTSSAIGEINLGDWSRLTAENITVSDTTTGAAVNVTLGDSSQFLLGSEGRTSKIATLNTGASSQFTVKNATVEVSNATGSGNIAVGSSTASGCTGANMYVTTLSMRGGSIYVDPSYGETSVLIIENVGTDGTLNTNITAGPGALVTIGMGSADGALRAVQSNLENETTINSSSSLIYVATPITLGATGSLTANPNATAAATGADGTVNAKKGGVIVIDQEKVGLGTTVFSGAKSITVDDASDGTTSSTLAVINIVDGTTEIPLTDVASPKVTGENYTVLTDNPYVTAVLDRAAGVIRLTEGATDNGMTVIASMGAQSMIRRIDTVLSRSVANRFAALGDSTKGANLWADISGERYEQDHIGAGASFAANMGYGAFGAELTPTEGTLLGAAFQYSHGTLKGDTYSVKNKIKAYSATAYGAVDLWDTGVKLTAEVAVTKSKNDVSTSYYTGLIQDFDAKMISGALGVQKTFTLGGFDVTPSVGVRASKIKTDAMKAGLIEVAEQSQTLVQFPIAVRFDAKALETQSGWAVSPKFRLAFTPTFGDKEIEAFGGKCTVIDVNPVEGAFGIGFAKGNFRTDIEANFGAGRRGTTSLGGKIGVNYRF